MKATGIGWTHSTVNGSSGCEGCELWNELTNTCYAGQMQENRLALSLPDLYAPNFFDIRLIPGRFAKAAKWGPPTAKEIEEKPWMKGLPRHIFVGDMGDFLSTAVPDKYLEDELLAAIKSPQGSRHVWQLLTKRPKRLAELSIKWHGLPSNVVGMTTVTSQRTAEVRIPHLLATQCHTRGLSVEPLLEEVDLSKWLETGQIHWVIVGGESGKNCRPMDIRWVRKLRDQCARFGVAFFFKQWGGLRKEAHGRLLDGRTHDEMPKLALAA